MDVPTNFCARFHESSNRPHLILGCEPTAIMLVFALSIVIVFSVPNRYGIGFSIGLFVFLRKMLQEMAKDDPRLITVHHNSQRYNAGFWTAKPRRPKRWRN